ncbi:MAG TPA: hypothetical protein VD788_00445 [Candidatus Polarisedimenticolaceae bacterium]|nr:hypothetical protein [Candidatus Polarisedimenticolaceae bacterium]
MSMSRRERSLVHALMLILFAAAPMIAMTGSVAADTPSSPPVKDCGAKPEDSAADPDVYSRTLCRQDAVVAQLEHLVDVNLTGSPLASSPGMTAQRRDLAARIKQEARMLHGKLRVDDFETAAKGVAKYRKAEGCEWVPLVDDNDNGICDWPDEQCQALNYPEKSCDPRAKKDNPNNERYICAENCATWALRVSDEQEAEHVAQDLERTYEEIEKSVLEVNDRLAFVNALLVEDASAVDRSAESCDDIYALPDGLVEAMYFLRGAHAGLAMVADIGAALNNQTVVVVAVAAGFGGGGGGNGSALSAILAGAEGLADIAHKAVQAEVETRTSLVQDRTFACLQETIASLQVVNGKLDQTATELADKLDRNRQEILASQAALEARIEQARAELAVRLDQITVLLSTPLGQRPGYPQP